MLKVDEKVIFQACLLRKKLILEKLIVDTITSRQYIEYIKSATELHTVQSVDL